MSVKPHTPTQEQREAEKKHTLLLDTLPYGVQESDTEGVIHYSNIAHHRILGFEPGKLIGHYIWDFLPDTSHQQRLREYLTHLITEQPPPEPYVTINITRDGREVLLEINWDYQRNDAGEVIGFISVISDITARAQAEQELKRSEASLAQAERIAHIGSWELDLVQNQLRWSNEVFRIFEVDCERFNASYEAFLDAVHPDDRDFVNQAYTESVACRTPYDITHRLLFEDDRTKYVNERGETFYDETGTAVRSIGTIQDITARYQSEQSLKYHKTRLRTLIDTIPDLVWLKDSAGTYLDCNRKFEHFFGASRSDIIGKTDFDFVDSDLATHFRQKDQEAIASGKPCVNEEWVTYASDGHRELLETIKTPAVDEQGKWVNILGISRDITVRKQAELAWRENEARYHELVDNMSDGVAVYEVVGDGEDFIFKEHNLAGSRITGLARERVIGKSVQEIFPGIKARELFYVFQRVWHSGRPEHHPVTRYQDDRLSLWVENYVFKLPSGEIVAIYEDVTERKLAEKTLHDRLTLEAALAEVSSNLMQAGDIGLNRAIDAALECIGTAVDADRSYFFQIDGTADTFSNTHQWCRYGVLPQKPELQRLPVSDSQPVFARFRKGKLLHVQHPEELGDELAPLRNFMQQAGIHSLVNVPILWKNSLLGVVGFDSDKRDKTWPDEDIRLLRTVAENFGWALASQAASECIHANTWFLESLDKVSEILTGGQDAAPMLRLLTALILEIFEVDRAWLLHSPTPAASAYQVTVETTRPEYPGAFTEGVTIPKDTFAAEIRGQTLSLDHPLVIQSDEITDPPEYIGHYQIQSQMMLVLQPRIGDALLLGVHQCSHKREWSTVEQRLFHTIAGRLSIALSGSQLLERIRASERRLLEAEHLARIGSWELDLPDGNAVWSDQEYRCLGYRPRSCDAGDASFETAVHPEDRAWVNQAMRAAINGDRDPYDIEHRVIWEDGSEHVVHERGLVERDEDGNPLRVIGTTQDITARVRMEQELEMHRRGLEQLVEERTTTIREQAQIIDQTHDSVVTTDLDGQITSWNSGAEHAFGVSAGETIGRHISFVYAGNQHDFLQNEIIAPLKEKGTHEIEVILKHADDSEFPAHLSLSLLYDNNGEPKGMVGYAVDISELKQRERDLQHLTKRLQAANQELESFSYSVSHDLRAPLRAIDGFSLALAEDYGDRLDETALDYLRRVRNGAQRMGLLIDDLLLLSRMSRSELQMEEVDLTAIARSVIDELQAGQPGHPLELRLDPDMRVRGDPRLLRVMLDNLLGNAWKFTSREAAPHIALQRSKDDPEVFYISDNGVGFDMRYADKLFGAFQRLHRTSDFPGSGVGLATVQRIVHRHGGRIWAEAEEGKGATFYFSLCPAGES